MTARAIMIGWIAVGGLILLSRQGGRNNSALDVADVGTSLALATLEGGSVVNMKLSGAGLQAIADREGGFKATRYRDADGYSIGFGHYILAGEFFNDPISYDQGWQLLLSDTALAVNAVQAYVKVPLSQNQFDALVSFAYNAGTGALKNSTLLRLLNAGDYQGAADQFMVWDKKHVDGVLVFAPELADRRGSEQSQFLS